MSFIPVMVNFSHYKYSHYSSLKCHMILQKSLLICWFAAEETFLIISNVKNGGDA